MSDITESLFDIPFEEEGRVGESGRPRLPVTEKVAGSNPVVPAISKKPKPSLLFDVHKLRNGNLLIVFIATQASEEWTPTEAPWQHKELFRYEERCYTRKVKK